MLVSASMSLRQRLIHDLGKPWEVILWLLALAAPSILVTIFVRPPGSRPWLMRLAVYLPVVLLLASALVPSLAKSESAEEGQGVALLSTTRVGNYDVSVLKATSARDLSVWLQQQHLHQLPPAGAEAVEDYIGRGWCFAVAVLRPEGPDPATPHPIMATFPASAPVFPMQLTALAGSRTHVDLVVVADQRAEAAGFHLVACDVFDNTYKTKNERLSIQSPAVRSLLWNGCVVSHLIANLEPVQMQRDVTIELTKFSPHRDSMWTARGRNELVLTVLALGTLPLVAMATITLKGRSRPSRGAAKLMLGSAGLVLLAALGVRLLLPVIPVGASSKGGIIGRLDEGRRLDRLLNANEEKIEAGEGSMEDRILRIIHADPKLAVNELQGGLRRWECSPGNLGLRDSEGEKRLVVYDADTEETVVRVFSGPAK